MPDRVSAVHGRRAKLEKKDETNKDRISEVVGSEGYYYSMFIINLYGVHRAYGSHNIILELLGK